MVPPDESEVDNARQYAIGSLTIATASHRGMVGNPSLLASMTLICNSKFSLVLHADLTLTVLFRARKQEPMATRK